MLKNPTFLLQESRNFSSEDLEFMRRAFQRACDENPEITETEEKRDMLAKAIFGRYQRGLNERDLVTMAFWAVH
jgi:hypothetical protein